MTDKAFLDLLGLQAIDTEIDQLLHSRESLPELEQYKDTYETITNLNATAATDSFGLYNTDMGASVLGGIKRTGLSGSYAYTVKTVGGVLGSA